MKPRTLRAGRGLLLPILALCLLSAQPAVAASCVAQSQAAYQQCITTVATFNNGVVSPSAAASCSMLAATTRNACQASQYVVCSQPYSGWVTTNDEGEVTGVVVSFYGQYSCQ